MVVKSRRGAKASSASRERLLTTGCDGVKTGSRPAETAQGHGPTTSAWAGMTAAETRSSTTIIGPGVARQRVARHHRQTQRRVDSGARLGAAPQSRHRCHPGSAGEGSAASSPRRPVEAPGQFSGALPLGPVVLGVAPCQHYSTRAGRQSAGQLLSAVLDSPSISDRRGPRRFARSSRMRGQPAAGASGSGAGAGAGGSAGSSLTAAPRPLREPSSGTLSSTSSPYR